MKKNPRRLPMGLFFLLTLLFSTCGRSSVFNESASEYVLGTICTISLYEQGKPELYSKAFARLRELEDILSANREGTDLDRVNKNAGLEPVKVRPELIEVLRKALYYAEKSNGAFDPTVGPLVRLWGIGTDKARVPGMGEIRAALDLINYREVEIDQEEGTVYLRRQGMALDLGAIAKGYAADEIVKLLEREGVTRAIVDLGGNIFAMGEKKNKKDSAWLIGIQDPRENRGSYIGVLKVKNKTVVTSGMYERYFVADRKQYHHIFSTMDGYPADNNILSVTIVSDESIDADALSTAAFVLGLEKSRDLIASVPGAVGVFVYKDLTVRLSGEIPGGFSLTAAEYRLF